MLCGRGPLFLAAAADLCYDSGALQDNPGTEMMKTFDWQRLLRQHSLFSSLSEEEIARLLDDEVSQERDCPQDQVILREGSWADSIFLIGSGAVSVVLLRKDGEKVTLSTLRGGEFFGEMALLDQRPRSATVIANERCSLLEIKGDEFLKLMHNHSDVEFKVMLNLSERLRQASEQVLAVRLSDVDEKINIFDTKLDARLKAADAQMEAAQTVFDQTNTRANEIIESAERSRTRLTTAVSTIGGIIAIVVGLGGSISYFSLQDTFKQVKEDAAKVKDHLGEIKKRADNAAQNADKIAKHAVEVSKAQVDVEELAKREFMFRETLVGLVESLFMPGFHKAIEKGDMYAAIRNYQNIRRLSPTEPSVTEFLAEIEDQMLAPISEIQEQTVAQNDQNDQEPINYAALLGSIFKDAVTPEEKIQSTYLLLTSMIINEQEEVLVGEISRKYGKLLSQLEASVEQNKDHGITMNSNLSALIDKNNKNKRRRFCKISGLVHLDDQEIQTSFCQN